MLARRAVLAQKVASRGERPWVELTGIDRGEATFPCLWSDTGARTRSRWYPLALEHGMSNAVVITAIRKSRHRALGLMRSTFASLARAHRDRAARRHAAAGSAALALILAGAGIARAQAAVGVPDTAATPRPEPPASAEPESSLLPPGEEQRMSSHPIAADELAFKPGKGFSATSEDGDFQMNLGVRAQFLFGLLGAEGESERDTEYGFQIRRARVAFTGHMFDPRVKYKLELAVAPRDVNMSGGVVTTSPLLDFYTDLTHLRDLSVRVGQYKVPFNRQRVISSGALQFVDRSIVNAEFNLDRDIGVDLRSEDLFGLGLLRYYLGVYPGGGRNSFEDEEAFHPFYLGRVEVLPFGDFEDYVEADFERTGPRLSVGASAAYIDDSPRDRGVLGTAPADGGTTDFMVLEADVMFKMWGLSISSELFYRDGERAPGVATDEGGELTIDPARDGIGWTIQGGYLLPRVPLEFALRYSAINGKDEAGEDGLGDLQEYVIGASYYFAHHQLKLQADYARLVDDAGFGSGTDQVRAQLQIAY